VDFLFDAKAFPHGEVHVVVDIASADSVETAGALAAGLARRFGYKKVLFTASDAIVPGRDNVVVGPKEFAEAAAARAGLTLDVGGSVLQVSPLPVGRDAEGRSLTDPTRGLVVVSGKDAAEVRRSALTLGTMSIPVPGSARTEVSGVSLPETAPYAGSRLLQAGKDYSFKSLDFRTYTFRKVNPLATDIVFRLPNDYRIEPNKYMTLMLNFIYGPGMQAASSLTVSVNNEVARTIPLDKMAGDFITGYRLDLPTYLFKPGMNTLTFTSYLTPKGGDCEMILPDSYFMTLYDNSTLRFPGMTHFTRLPEIGLFMDDGFPYTRWRDGRECEIFIARADHGLLAAAFNVLGFMTQKCEHALFAARVRVGVPGAAGPAAPEKELIVIGGLDSLPPDFFDGAPLKLGKGSDSSHPAPGWGESPRFAAARQSGGIDPDDGLLMQFQSPAMRGRSTLLLTAVSDEKVVRLSRLLLLPALSAQMRGALVFVDLKAEADNKVTSVPARDGYWTGKLGRISALTYFLHVYPYTNYLLAALLLLLAGLLGTYVLVRIRRRRLAVAEGRDAGR
jgi:cellulose synthase operon protein B